ncbi:MAG: FKBP-type peptidyl-prolyl cis-trans isomerase [Dysgonamonadaceae bacterium]|jgi:FKBP-type peptidyl-prolyl cis-trans isomerase FklB|nr:FKBP-type peptidyl-prolyl cis-trans isomerase [Dysgonamonadaceae bacterium]
MKKMLYPLWLICCMAVLAACGSNDDETDYAWKQANENAFNALADSVATDADFIKVSIPGGPGAVYCKKQNKADDVIGTDTAKYTDIVTVTYKGWLINGTVFEDATYIPMTFKIDGSAYTLPSGATGTGISVISGWKIALQNMREGERLRVWIPWDLAYGTSANGSIPAYSTLIFDIFLEKIY